MHNRTMLGFAAVLMGWIVAFSAWAADPAELALFVFKQGKPVSGLLVIVDSAVSGKTDRVGAVYLEMPAGRHDIRVKDNEVELAQVDLQTESGESLEIIVTLPVEVGVQPVVDIESSRTGGSGSQARLVDADAPKGPPGQVVGQIKDVETGQGVVGARVFISGVALEAETDAEGRFSLEVLPGEYSMSVIHADYSTQTLDRLTVASNEQTQADMELSPAGIELADFVVTAPYIEGSIASVVSQQRETSEVTEVIGAEQMSRSGDSDAADALRRVSGLTLDQGKFVVIRGQPSRYTSTTWNGSPLPSPDPIRRIVPLDLFPTGVLSGVEVQKSYSADRQGEFGAGLIDLQTKSVPKSPFASFSVDTGYNTQSTGKDGFSSEGGARDFLGIDDGTRALPESVDAAISGGSSTLDDLSREERKELGADFSNNYEIREKTLAPDVGFTLSGGTNYATGIGNFGVLASFSWGRQFRIREEVDKSFALSQGQLVEQGRFLEQRADMDVDLGSLFVLGWETEKHKLSGNFFLIRKLTERNQIDEGVDANNDGLRSYLIEWNERQMLIGQLAGSHELPFLKIEWRALKAKGDRNSPDRRTYTYRQPESTGDFVFRADVGALRRHNEVDDKITGLGLDLTVPVIESKAFDFKFKVGGAYDKQDRESFISRFRFEPSDSLDQALLLSANPEDFLTPENILNDDVGFFDDSQANEDYTGRGEVKGVYVMSDIDIAKTVRLVGGLRIEESDFSVTSFQGGTGGEIEKIEGGFNETDLLPAATLTYKFLGDMQLRLGYSQTVSRPVLVELSASRFFDPQESDDYRGDPELKPAQIESFDVRWEWYPSGTESVTLGGFAKRYTDPIEVAFSPVSGGSSLTLLRTMTNAERAKVYGLEAGARTELGRLGDWLDKLYVQINATFLTSDVTLAEGGNNTSTSRPLAGQAENVYNGQLGYDGERHDLTLSFNRVGRRLETAGATGLPDTFQQPESYLNFAYGWRFSKRGQFKFKAGNILNPETKYVQGGELDRTSKRGVTLGAALKWEFL